MKYLLMMHAPRGTGEYEIFSWAPEDLQAHMAFLQRFNRELVESGEWVDVLGLTPPGEAKLVRAGADGAPVTDGPFPEAKEFLAGFWIVDVDSPERAYELAAKASAAPGPGGALLNTPIEVRRVMSGPPQDS
ncbi:MAG TPA: YciI family protein [Longimicrobiaceae bacterium]